MPERAPKEHHISEELPETSRTRRDLLRFFAAVGAVSAFPTTESFAQETPTPLLDVVDTGDIVEQVMSPEAHQAYAEGVLRLRTDALTLPYEKMATFVFRPSNGTYEWITPSTEETHRTYSQGFSFSMVQPDAGYIERVQNEFEAGGMVEYMHSHTVGARNDTATPPSPQDIQVLILTKANIDTETDLKQYTFTAVTGQGTWRYDVSSKESAKQLRNVLVSGDIALRAFIKEHTPEVLAFERYEKELLEFMMQTPNLSPQNKDFLTWEEENRSSRKCSL